MAQLSSTNIYGTLTVLGSVNFKTSIGLDFALISSEAIASTSYIIPKSSATSRFIITTASNTVNYLPKFSDPYSSGYIYSIVDSTFSESGAGTTIGIGNVTAAQTIGIGTASTGASTYNFATAPCTGLTKTVNIGTGGGAATVTTITIGSAILTSATNIVGNQINIGSDSGGTVYIKENITVNSSYALTLAKTTNQIILGTTNTVTISSTAPAASRVYTLPDALGNFQIPVTAASPTTNTLVKYTGTAGLITNSGISDDATTITFAASRNLSMSSGTGTFTQTYANSSVTGATINILSVAATRTGVTTGADTVSILNLSFTRSAGTTAGTIVNYGTNIAVTDTTVTGNTTAGELITIIRNGIIATSVTDTVYGSKIALTRSAATSATALNDYGVRTDVTGLNLASQTAYGGYFLSTVAGTTAAASYGVYASAAYGTTTYGIYAIAANGTTNWAGYFSGNVYMSNLRRMPQVAAPGSPVVGDAWNDSTQLCDVKYYSGGIKQYDTRVLFTQTNSVSITASGASTMLGTGIGTLTLPSNFFAVGKMIRIRIKGYITTAAGPGTDAFIVSLGGTTVCSSASITLPVSLTNASFTLDCDITCRTTGAPGTAFGQGLITIAAPSVLTNSTYALVATATASITTTGTLAVNATNNFGTGSTNTLVLTNASVEVLA